MRASADGIPAMTTIDARSIMFLAAVPRPFDTASRFALADRDVIVEDGAGTRFTLRAAPA